MPRFRQLFYLRRRNPDGAEAELRDELDAHIALCVDELVAQGIHPVDAEARARARFGDYERASAALAADARHRERRMHRRDWLDGLAQDFRYALVQLRRAPGHAAAVALTLAIGIGATTMTFSLVREVLWRQLPFTAPHQLVRVWAANPVVGNERASLSVPDFDDWRRAATGVERMAAFSTTNTGLVITGDGEPTQLRTAYVTEDFFATLGVAAHLGRALLPAEHVEGQDRVVVLSHALWRSRFGSDPAVVGRTVRLRDVPFTVVGVMPPAMRYPDDVEVWAPLSLVPPTSTPRTRDTRWWQVVARLRPGIAPAAAQAELTRVAARVAETDPGTLAGWTEARVLPLAESIQGAVRPRLLLLLGAVGLVLALGCVNVANLALVRATGRARELAVRAALGAGRARLIRQLLVEHMVLALVGGALGVAIAWWGGDVILRATSRWMPPVGEVRPDLAVLAFAAGLSVLTGIVTGLLPATRQPRETGTVLREGTRGSSGGARTHALRVALVVAQVALAVTLVAGAGLLVKSFARLGGVELGFDTEHTVGARFTPSSARYASSAQYQPAVAEMMARIAQIPGVTSVAATKDEPLRSTIPEELQFTLPEEGATQQVHVARAMPTTPGWFATMGVPLRAGRDLRDPEDSLTASVVISEGLARLLWPEGTSPIGRELIEEDLRLRVVGVVADVRWTRVDSAPPPMIYLSHRIVRRRGVHVVARTTGDPAAIVPAMRAAIRAVNPDQPIQAIGPVRDLVADATAAPRFMMLVVTVFGALALLLAALGVYGVVAYVVGQRTRDIGIRVALGARTRDVAAWALRLGLGPVAMGVVAGLVGSLALARAIRAQLFEVSPNDPMVFAGVAATVVVVSVLATAVPARRAMRVDPVEALRRE